MRAEEVFVNLEESLQFVCLIKSWSTRSSRFLSGPCVHLTPGRDVRDCVSICPSGGSRSLHPEHPLSPDPELKLCLWHCHHAGPPTSGTEVPVRATRPWQCCCATDGVGRVGIVVGYGQHRVKLPPHGSPGQGIFAWILHWNLKSTATRKHLFSCPSMIKQVAPRHKEAEFPLGELFSFCCKISNILTFPSDFSLYQSCNGRTISRHLDFRGLLVSEHSLLYKGTLLKGRVISLSETKGKVTKTRAL